MPLKQERCPAAYRKKRYSFFWPVTQQGTAQGMGITATSPQQMQREVGNSKTALADLSQQCWVTIAHRRKYTRGDDGRTIIALTLAQLIVSNV